MPSRETVAAFVADVMSEDHVGAIARWYADDASMQENQGEPRVGKDVLMAREQQMMDRVETVTTEIIGQPLVEGDEVAIRWRFEFVFKDGTTMAIEEIAWQIWRDDKIWCETFFYDPAQRRG